MVEAEILKINGLRCIKVNSFNYINTRYQKPYLAVISSDGEYIWQDKQYVGYGKSAEVYYSVENLKPGDLIKVAGGSGSNRYPFVGFVKEIDDQSIKVEPLEYQEFGNILAERQKIGAKNKYKISKVLEMNLDELKKIFSDDMIKHITSSAMKMFQEDQYILGFIIDVESIETIGKLVDAESLENAEIGLKYLRESKADYLMVRS